MKKLDACVMWCAVRKTGCMHYTMFYEKRDAYVIQCAVRKLDASRQISMAALYQHDMGNCDKTL